MSHPQFRPIATDDCLAHAIEEAGEFISAAAKAQRFGFLSVNPLEPPEDQETNLAWMRREMVDVREAFDRLEAQLTAAFGAAR